jgi:D-alanyl-D-alanine carboxypeptidase
VQIPAPGRLASYPDRMPLVRPLAAACLVFGLVAGQGLPAVAAGRGHDRLAQARANAARLDAKAKQERAQIAVARRELTALDVQANAALDALQRASAYSAKTQAAQQAAQQALTAAVAQTTSARAALAGFAADAYRVQASGGTLGQTLSLVETGDPQVFLDGLAIISQVGKSEGQALDDLRVAEAGQQRATENAAAAADQARLAQRAAAMAKQHSDALVAAQQSAIAALQRLLARTTAAAHSAHALAARIAAARARAAAIWRAEAAAAAAAARAGGPVAGCRGGSLAGYPNGRLPASALCSLWAAPGQMLRSDAAAAFNRMSKAFARAFGEPLCVAASYRTYQRQVELYATMPPGYAAVPGTSNHGWAIAVDLCGGIQVDNSPEHIWLLDHAAAYNWFHPAWAMPGGAGPHEPWHWEYAG